MIYLPYITYILLSSLQSNAVAQNAVHCMQSQPLPFVDRRRTFVLMLMSTNPIVIFISLQTLLVTCTVSLIVNPVCAHPPAVIYKLENWYLFGVSSTPAPVCAQLEAKFTSFGCADRLTRIPVNIFMYVPMQSVFKTTPLWICLSPRRIIQIGQAFFQYR